MLYAASVKVSLGKNHRRVDVIVDAKDLEKAQDRALKQARSIYAPGKKAQYTIVGIINETEAFESFFARLNNEEQALVPDDANKLVTPG